MRIDDMLDVGEQVMVCGNMPYQAAPKSNVTKKDQIAVKVKSKNIQL